jgi:hypothetical protein
MVEAIAANKFVRLHLYQWRTRAAKATVIPNYVEGCNQEKIMVLGHPRQKNLSSPISRGHGAMHQSSQQWLESIK